MKILASLSASLCAAGPAAAAQGPGVAHGNADWLLQLPAQIIVLMMAGFVVWGFIKKRCRSEFDNDVNGRGETRASAPPRSGSGKAKAA